MRVVEWEVPPVLEKLLAMLEYAWSVVLHLQAEASLVVTERVAWVVPAVRTWLAVGAVMFAMGGVVSFVAQIIETFVTLEDETVPEPLETVQVWPEGWDWTITE